MDSTALITIPWAVTFSSSHHLHSSSPHCLSLPTRLDKMYNVIEVLQWQFHFIHALAQAVGWDVSNFLCVCFLDLTNSVGYLDNLPGNWFPFRTITASSPLSCRTGYSENGRYISNLQTDYLGADVVMHTWMPWDTPEYLKNPWGAGMYFTRPLWDPFPSRGCWIFSIAQTQLDVQAWANQSSPRKINLDFSPFNLSTSLKCSNHKRKCQHKSSDGMGRGMKRGQGWWKQVGIAWPRTDSTESLTLGRNTQSEWQNTT